MIAGSRRGSVHTVHGFWVSILPQVLQTWILSIATCSAAESGVISASRFLIRCNAARRAERGPSPGSRASSWIRRSISGPATAAAMSGEAQPRRQTQAAGQGLHLLLHRGFRLALRVVMGGDQQVFEDFTLVRLHHHAEKISHQPFLLRLLLIVAVRILGRIFTASIGFRRLGGKLAYLDNLGAGKSRQHLLHPGIGFGGALALALLQFVLRPQRRL